MYALMAHEPQQQPKTMSSCDIAALTGKNHADVMRDIRKMLATLGIAESTFAGVYLGGNGQQRKCYNLPRRETEILITGYDVVRRAAVIDRWFQLENVQRNNIPVWITDLSPQAQICLTDLSSQLTHQKQLTAQVSAANECLTEQVDLLQRTIESIDLHFVEGCTIPDFCRSLNGVNIQKVNSALEQQRVLYPSKNGRKVSSRFRDKYFREIKENYGNEGKFRYRIEVTRKGAKLLYSRYADGRLPMNQNWDNHYFHSLA